MRTKYFIFAHSRKHSLNFERLKYNIYVGFFLHPMWVVPEKIVLRNNVSCTIRQSASVRNRGRGKPLLFRVRSRWTGQRQTHTRAPPKVSRPPLFPVRYTARSRPISHFIIRVLPWANRWPRLRGLIYLNYFPNFHSPPPPPWWCALDTITDPPPSGGPRSLARIQHFTLPLIDAAGRGYVR